MSPMNLPHTAHAVLLINIATQSTDIVRMYYSLRVEPKLQTFHQPGRDNQKIKRNAIYKS